MASVHTIAGLWRTDSTPNGQETDLNPSRFKSFRSSFDLHFQRMFCGVLAYILSTRISLVQNVKRPKLRPTWLGLSLASNQSFRRLVSAEHEPSLLTSRAPKVGDRPVRILSPEQPRRFQAAMMTISTSASPFVYPWQGGLRRTKA